MTKQRKPKLIPLRELRPLCKEAGLVVQDMICTWEISRGVVKVMEVRVHHYSLPGRRIHRQNLKAFCLGLIAMKKAGEL